MIENYYTYAYNRDKGVYEVKEGNDVIAEKASMREAKSFVDFKSGKSVKPVKTLKLPKKKEIGFGEWEVPAFFNYKAGK